MNRWLVGAAHKSSGKTTVAIGLAAALRERGLLVQPFKKGPDYIDPMWLGLAAGRACRNLDPHIAGWDETEAAFRRHAASADACIVEGNHGLHDGMAADGSDSNAALGLRLDLPVILVLDTRGTARGIAPLVLGYQAFEPRLKFAGVLLNRVGGSRHETKLRQALERYTDVPVLGAIGEDPRLAIAERHLGLTPSNEAGSANRIVRTLAFAIAQGVDLERLLAPTPRRSTEGSAGRSSDDSARRSSDDSARSSNDSAARSSAREARAQAGAQAGAGAGAGAVRIAIARDEAFGFYYADDLEALAAEGAQLVPFDTLRDASLPAVDGLLIGGGFPEALAARLQDNAPLRGHLRALLEAGLPAYAECGGLMYLARSITWRGERFEMVGAIPGDAVMQERAVGRGYVRLAQTDAFPWPAGAGPAEAPARAEVRAHEFHHSSLENLEPGLRFAYRVLRGHGIDGAHDGIVQRNLLASYAHLRGVGARPWPARFVAFVRQVRERRARAATLAA